MTTIFCDIDGILFNQNPDFTLMNNPVLPLAKQRLLEWHTKGYTVILVTGRTEPMRQVTEQQLIQAELFYDQLVMGVGCGPRILINDIDPAQPNVMKAIAINIERNRGLQDTII